MKKLFLAVCLCFWIGCYDSVEEQKAQCYEYNYYDFCSTFPKVTTYFQTCKDDNGDPDYGYHYVYDGHNFYSTHDLYVYVCGED